MSGQNSTIPNTHEPLVPLLVLNLNQCIELTPTTFRAWSTQIEDILFGFDLFKYVDGSYSCPSATRTTADKKDEPNPAYHTWIRQDRLIKGALLGTIHPSITPLLLQAKTSNEVWTTLTNTYANTSRGHILQIKDRLKSISTRSKKTAQIVGDVRVHELQGLPEEESWCLFRRMAFLPNQLENPDDELIKLGKTIVKKCLNVPLAIRVVASLLCGEPMLKWLSFCDKELANISEKDDTMNNILRLSYHQLAFPLKSCFSYCAIFPKDFVIDKEMLISLWMAQGYISTEFVGEEYFLMLLQRCFFQNIEMNEGGEIKRFKIHDLLHDIAEQVAGEDIYRLSSYGSNVRNKVRHIFLLYDFCLPESFNKTHVRTYIITNNQFIHFHDIGYILRGNVVSNWACLRSLVLRYLEVNSLPESISELFHLRCLDLSYCSSLRVLPDSITQLVNLQTLDLSYCTDLQELPKNVRNLVDLSTLNLIYCWSLSYMPSGMGSLTHLHTLGWFVVARNNLEGKQCFDALEDLRSMSNLKGFLEARIWVNKIANYVKEDHGEGAYLSNKKRLNKIKIRFTCLDFASLSMEDITFKDIERAELLLEEMQPHYNLKELRLEGYIGEIMPRWPSKEDNLTLFHLPNLVTLKISDCFLLRCLPSLGELPHLKDLTLKSLPKVEYMVDAKPEACGLGKRSSLFPSLQKLCIRYLPNLKGWWPRLGSGLEKKHLVVSVPIPCFAQLKHLEIGSCPLLESFPVSSSLEFVSIDNFPQAKVWDHMQVFRGLLLKCTQSDSKSRMWSIGDFESNIDKDIDTKLTTDLHLLMSSHGYNSMGIRCND